MHCASLDASRDQNKCCAMPEAGIPETTIDSGCCAIPGVVECLKRLAEREGRGRMD